MKDIEPKTEQKTCTPQEFASKYQALCEECGYQLVVTPAYKVSQDTGVWGTVLQVSVGKLPKQE